MPLHRRHTAPPLSALPYTDCAAKTQPDGSPGVSVLDHGVRTAEVARELVRFLPRGLRETFGTAAVSAAAAHDVGKVSPGFQKKIANPALTAQTPEVARRSL
ncbi:MAG: hypothetical protein GXP31_14265, partial [Kiritimatiellaeota bacterium]|nr:hypothetical protein [Kiritimatiellota bacterium]